MRNKQKVRKLAPAGLAKLLASAAPGWRPYIATVAYTGARASEALALRWQDVDTKAGFIRVTHQLGRDGKLVSLKTDDESDRGRVIPMTPALRATLLELRMASRHRSDHEYVFSTVSGKPRSYRNALRAFDAAAKRAGVDGGDGRLSLHSLRHTAASLWIRAGVPIVTVSKMLGHSKVSTTLDIYADVIAELDTNLGEELGAAFAVSAAK
jgi:integrase